MTYTIFLIEDTGDIDTIKKEKSIHTDSKIFALNYFAQKDLEENQIPHEIGEYYLTLEDKKNIDDMVINTTLNWGIHNSIKDLLTFYEINLASLIEMELLVYFERVYGNAVTISKIIEKEHPERIICYTNLNDYVQRICKEKNIEVISHNLMKPPPSQFDDINIKYNLGSYPISFNMSRATFLRLKKILEKVISVIFNLAPNYKLAKNKSILLVDFNPVQYDVLINELSALNKNILLLNQRRPAVWNFASFKIIKNSKCKIIHLDHFEKKIKRKILEQLNVVQSNLAKVWDLDSIFEGIFLVNSHSLWYSIKNSFTKTCSSRFSDSVRRILLLNELFDKFNMSVILEWAETGQEEKEIISIAKKRKVKSIMLQHAMDPSTDKWDKYHRFVLGGYSYFISDKQALWGESIKRRAISYGHKEENLLVTGSPRHDNFFRAKNNIKSKGIILFATTSVTGRISYEQTKFEAYLKFENFVREVCQVVKKFPDKQLIVKPHPQPDIISKITDLIREIDPHIPILYNANLVELIKSCDVLITFNNSTVALESMILNKPTISLQIEEWAQEDEIVQKKALVSIKNIDEVENELRKLLYDKKFRDEILENSNDFVENYLANRGHASSTLVKILDSF